MGLNLRSIELCDGGILDVTKNSLTTKMLPVPAVKKLFRKINEKFYPDKVAFFPQDAYKSTIGVFRWSSDSTLKLTCK